MTISGDVFCISGLWTGGQRCRHCAQDQAASGRGARRYRHSEARRHPRVHQEAKIIALLQQSEGASTAEIVEATDPVSD